jgi:hypothetical protein
MFGRTIRRLAPHSIQVVAMSVTILSTFGIVPMTASASGSHTVPTCLHNQLVVAVAWDEPPAAGSNGIPFLIANISKTSCSIQGFPELNISPDRYKKRSLKVLNGGGGLFARLRPHLVIIKPGEDASFGLGFGDGSNQQDPSGAPCMTQDVEVGLPVRVNEIAENYETPLTFNFCDADFQVEVTPFESGPLPRLT